MKRGVMQYENSLSQIVSLWDVRPLMNFMALQTAGQQTFVALGKAKQAVFFSLFRKVIIVVPLTIALPYIFGINGVMLAEPISNVIGGCASYFTMRHMVMPELKAMDAEK